MCKFSIILNGIIGSTSISSWQRITWSSNPVSLLLKPPGRHIHSYVHFILLYYSLPEKTFITGTLSIVNHACLYKFTYISKYTVQTAKMWPRDCVLLWLNAHVITNLHSLTDISKKLICKWSGNDAPNRNLHTAAICWGYSRTVPRCINLQISTEHMQIYALECALECNL